MPGPGSAYEPISVLIPPKDRPTCLERAVEVVLSQTTLRVKALFAAWSPSRKSVRLCCIHEPAIPGAAVARDRTMEEADGLIWLFLYDDMFEIGCALVAAVGSLHRRSLEPWRAFATGVREAAALGKPVGCSSLQR